MVYIFKGSVMTSGENKDCVAPSKISMAARALNDKFTNTTDKTIYVYDQSENILFGIDPDREWIEKIKAVVKTGHYREVLKYEFGEVPYFRTNFNINQVECFESDDNLIIDPCFRPLFSDKCTLFYPQFYRMSITNKAASRLIQIS
jgi:hypothetical protein